jgi:hypothetical protein
MRKALSKLSIALAFVVVSCTIVEAAVPIPHVEGPLAHSDGGALVWRVSDKGYVAEEYLISGTADTYAAVGMADAGNITTRDNTKDALQRESYDRTVLRAKQPYVTRIILYKPANVAKFSGNVVAEVAHPNGGGTALVWQEISGYFLSHGDVYVSIQHPATFDSVRKFDPRKYGALSAVDNTQLWGMIAQIGALIKGNGASSPLRHYPVKYLFLTGYSYTGLATTTFADFHHETSTLPDGRAIFDGYIPMGSSMYVRPLPVPIIRIMTQSDFNTYGGLNTRRDDSDSEDSPFRLYEVAGASHVNASPVVAGAKPPAPETLADPANLGPPRLLEGRCKKSFPADSGPNDVALDYVMVGVFENMYAWVRTGLKPPHAPRLETNSDGSAATDSSGNVLGGLRLPEIAVPVATYGVGSGECFFYGYRVPYSADHIKKLYGSRAQYLMEVSAKAQSLVEQHWLRAQEAAAIVEAAKRIPEF